LEARGFDDDVAKLGLCFETWGIFANGAFFSAFACNAEDEGGNDVWARVDCRTMSARPAKVKRRAAVPTSTSLEESRCPNQLVLQLIL
jgi:hypothetical protein